MYCKFDRKCKQMCTIYTQCKIMSIHNNLVGLYCLNIIILLLLTSFIYLNIIHRHMLRLSIYYILLL